MTMIYDMANGTMQSETSAETGETDMAATPGQVADLRLAMVETTHTPSGDNDPQTAIHCIRALLSSD